MRIEKEKENEANRAIELKELKLQNAKEMRGDDEVSTPVNV